MRYSEKLQNVNPSVTLSITTRAKAMKTAGEDVVILATGEPDFDTPDSIKEAAINAIKKGDTKYTPSGGTKTLKEAICRKFKRDNGLIYDAGEIIVSNGAKHSIYNILLSICNPGDEVIIISPYWLSYPEMVRLADADPVIVKTDVANGFKVPTREIENAITDRTKAIIINSPSNPAGVVYNEKELIEIGKICVENDILIISDEIYEKIIFEGEKHFSIAASSKEVRDITVVINGVSKSFSMTGWRIGYAAGDRALIKIADDLQSQTTSNPCSISQAAAEFALSDGLDVEIEKNRVKFEEKRNSLIEMFSGEKRIKVFKPLGAFYMFCDVSKFGLGSVTFSERLLNEAKVAVIPGGPFGEDGFIRLSFATDLNTLSKGAQRINEWVKKL